MAKQPTPKIVSKKHLARIERERIQRRNLLIGAIVVAVLVVGVLAYGLLDRFVLYRLQPVAVVNGEEIGVDEFESQAKLSRFFLIQQYQQYYSYNQMLGGAFDQSLQEIKLKLDDPTKMGQSVVDELVNDKLVEQKAEELGIEVTDAEVEEAFQNYFGYYPEGTPTAVPTLPAQPTSTLSALQMTLVPATETPTAIPETSPTSAEEASGATATPAETGAESEAGTDTGSDSGTEAATPESAAEEAAGDATPTATQAPTATPTPYTEEGFKTQVADYNSTLAEANISEAELKEYLRRNLLRRKVYESIVTGLEPVQEQVWARHILVSDEASAQSIYNQLLGGEDFVALAAGSSIDTSNAQSGGDLDWFARGAMVKEFEDAAFSLEVGEISPPVQTNFGFHIIQVLGHEERPLDQSAFESFKLQKYNEWVEQAKIDAVITQNENWINLVPTVPTLPPELA